MPADKSKAADAVKLLNKYHTQLQQQVNQMEQQVRDLESQIKAAFGIPEGPRGPNSDFCAILESTWGPIWGSKIV